MGPHARSRGLRAYVALAAFTKFAKIIRAARKMDHHADGAVASQGPAMWRILNMMKPARAATRRFLPTSPFKAPPDPPPAEQFAVEDQVTHEKYGLGRVVRVEEDNALVIDFGAQMVRITTPCAKLIKL